MSLTHASLVDHPIEQVYDWHARPGAITRLTPPWQPVRIAREASNLRDGTAVLRLPGGLRWTAQHQPGGHRPPHRFVDHVASEPWRRLLTWRHTHDFAATDGGRTRMTDTIETTVPAAVLRSMLAYRHHQLADDLAAQHRLRALDDRPRTIAISGSTGLVGTALCAFLTTAGHRVVRLVRHAPLFADERRWRPEEPAADLLDGVDAVIHLAGSSIAGRFTDAHKRALRDSRVEPTRLLADRAAATDQVSVFVSASAIGIYGPDRGDDRLTEDSGRGDGYLAGVVDAWELATASAAAAGVRCVQVRTGLVQSPRGGSLQLQFPLFAAGLGGRLGDGYQWQSWIGIDDLVDIYLRAVLDAELSGPVNAVAPNPVRNAAYTRVLGRVLRRPTVLPVPPFAPTLLLGAQGTHELALANQRVQPARLTAVGHRFRHAELEPALRHVLGRHDGNGAG